MWFITTCRIFSLIKMIFLKCKGLNYYHLGQRDGSELKGIHHKPEDLNWISETHTKEGKNKIPQAVL